MTHLSPLDNLRRVYCAGPLFNEAERQEMLQISRVLQHAGFDTFVPHADGMEFAKLRPFLLAQQYPESGVGQLLHAAVFALDVYQVAVGCGSLVFNMNGRVPDEGAVAEATMAWMLGKPVVLYKEDARSAIVGRDNPLIVGQARFRLVSTLDELPGALHRAVNERQGTGHWQYVCPPHLAETVAAGQRLWKELQLLDMCRDCAPVAEIIIDLFGEAHAIGPEALKSAGRLDSVAVA